MPSHETLRWRSQAIGAGSSAERSEAELALSTRPPVDRPGTPALHHWALPAFLIGYAALLALAETTVAMVSPVLVFPVHGGIIALLALLYAMLSQAGSVDTRSRRITAVFLVLLLAPIIRLTSLTLPLEAIDTPMRYLAAGVPMALAALLVARAAGMTRRDIGLQWSHTGWQVAVIAFSVGLGFIEYFILQPGAMGALPWTAAGITPALVVGISTGFAEELLFRGVLQTALRPLIGRWTVLYASFIFAALHIGYLSLIDFAFVFGVGLLYGWVFEKTRSIVGISIGHAVGNIVLFFVAPHLLPLAFPAALP